VAPVLSILEQCFESGEVFERYADGKLNHFSVLHADNVTTKVSAVYACLNDAIQQNCLYFPYAGQDEYLSAIGIMHVARAMLDIEHLTRLCDGRNQRVVAALPFFLPIKAGGRAFGEAAGG